MTTLASVVAGTMVRLTFGLTDIAGAAANPTTVTVKIRSPSGSTATASPTNDGVGAYHHDYTFALAGEYVVHVETTGNPTVVDEASVDVRAVVVA
jgi:hypothetical protein